MEQSGNATQSANWVVGPLTSILTKKNGSFECCSVQPNDLAFLIKKIDGGEISHANGRIVLEKIIETGKSPTDIIKENNLQIKNNSDEIEAWINQVIGRTPE